MANRKIFLINWPFSKEVWAATCNSHHFIIPKVKEVLEAHWKREEKLWENCGGYIP